MHRKLAASVAAVTLMVLRLARVGEQPGLPWEGPMQKLVSSLSGPIAKAIGVFAIVGCGFGMAFRKAGAECAKRSGW